MSEPIKAGDLVIVIRSCCGKHLGKISVVLGIGTTHDDGHLGLRCKSCGWNTEARLPCAELDFGKGSGWMLLTDLKRIPPMSTLEHFRTEESLRRDVKEPA